MPTHGRGGLAAQLCRPAGRPDAADADLLARYLADRDGPAFAALVARHGPLVLAVCRRVVGDATRPPGGQV